MSTSTVRLHRVLRATPEKIYRAFLDTDAMAKWRPPNGFTGKVHHIDAKVGGAYNMSFSHLHHRPPSLLRRRVRRIVATERIPYCRPSLLAREGDPRARSRVTHICKGLP